MLYSKSGISLHHRLLLDGRAVGGAVFHLGLTVDAFSIVAHVSEDGEGAVSVLLEGKVLSSRIGSVTIIELHPQVWV